VRGPWAAPSADLAPGEAEDWLTYTVAQGPWTLCGG